jgi:hypothetical protein
MKNQIMKFTNSLLVFTIAFYILGIVSPGQAQRIKWLRVSELQTPVNEIGAEYEGEFATGNTNFFSWPAQYSIGQNINRCKTLWIGCRDFDDPVQGKVKSYKVVGVNARDHADRPNQVFEQELKLIGRNPAPFVIVDDQNASELPAYDLVDEYDLNLECDRMVLVKFNTSVGVSVTKKVMIFANSEHGNYTINDYVFKNTGIYNRAGDVKEQTLHQVWFYFSPRYSMAGISNTGFNAGWGTWGSTWGSNVIVRSFGEDPLHPEFTDPSSATTSVMRGFFAWPGPSPSGSGGDASNRPEKDADWGTPYQLGDGTLSGAKFAGCLTLHADKSPDDPSDDLEQPHTTWYISADISIFQPNTTQYDEIFMADRYTAMSEGHPAPNQQHYVVIGDGYPIDWSDARRQSGGGVQESQSFGPYEMEPGDSIHIVFAEGVSGLSWEKVREVGGKWLQWYNATGNPELVLPDGVTTTTDYNGYKKQWVLTSQDSILKTFRLAKKNYESVYTLPQAPPPPESFTVASGGDRIVLSWANNAASAPHFDGYVIYRSRGNVMDWTTIYEKIFECNAANVVSTFNDVTAVRGFDYYYYIQSKDDGSRNDGKPLYSSLFWTITTVPATLQRPATPPHPYPPNMDNTMFKVTTDQGVWMADTAYALYDLVSYDGFNWVCVNEVEKDSLRTPGVPDNQGVSYWETTTNKGNWISGSSYKAYDLVNYTFTDTTGTYTDTYVSLNNISYGEGLELVRVVPNPYDIRSRMFQFGDKSQYDRIAFYNLPPVCKLKIFTERGDLVWQKDHTKGTGDELWDSMTSSGQIVASGIYILYVDAPGQGSVFRKFVIIR